MGDASIYGKRDLFSGFMHETAADLLVKTHDNDVSSIAKTVYGVIEKLLADVEQREPSFKVQELLKVGSFHEGTKILKADEFDFLAVIAELSEPGQLSINTQPEHHLPPYERTKVNHVKIQASKQIQRKWACTKPGGKLMNFLDVKSSLSFGKVVLDVIKACAAAQNISFEENSPSSIVFSERPLPLKTTVGAFLSLVFVQVLSPNVMLEFELVPPNEDEIDGTNMSVDLSPAVRYFKPEDCFDARLCGDVKLADAVLKRGSILFVNQHNLEQFKVTYTETEVEYMRDRLQLGHKRLYVFLKYCNGLVFSGIDGTVGKLTTSYMLKTACIYHDLECKYDCSRAVASTSKHQNQDIMTYNCFLSVLSRLCLWYKNGFVPSVFNTRQNLNTGSMGFNEGRMSDHVEELLCTLFTIFWRIYAENGQNQSLSDYKRFIKECRDSVMNETKSKFGRIQQILELAEGTDITKLQSLDKRVLEKSQTLYK